MNSMNGRRSQGLKPGWLLYYIFGIYHLKKITRECLLEETMKIFGLKPG